MEDHWFKLLCKLEPLEFQSEKEISQSMEETFDYPFAGSSMETELISYHLPPLPNSNLEFQDFDEFHCKKEITQTFVASPMATELISCQLPPLPNSNLEFQDFDDFHWLDQDLTSNYDSSSMINVNAPQPPPLQQVISDCNWEHSIGDVLSENLSKTHRESVGSSSSRTGDQYGQRRKCSRRPKSIDIELDEIKKHFNVPITKAAREMNVGLTVLKKRCRELHINRWPHRKIKSLASLIENVKKLGLTREVKMLEEHRRLMEKLPEVELTEETKKLRQACFKAKYKSRRSSAAAAAPLALMTFHQHKQHQLTKK